MAYRILSVEDKRIELKKFRDLVLATIDYHLEDTSAGIKTDDFDSNAYYESLKIQTLEHYNKGRLTKLKQWFRDLIEIQIEARNLKFAKYLQNKTGYDVNVFDDYFKRVEKIVDKGKITTGNQFFDISIMVDQLCSEHTTDIGKIHILNQLLTTYEARKLKKRA
jgi:hypothetical protein